RRRSHVGDHSGGVKPAQPPLSGRGYPAVQAHPASPPLRAAGLERDADRPALLADRDHGRDGWRGAEPVVTRLKTRGFSPLRYLESNLALIFAVKTGAIRLEKPELKVAC